MFDIFFDKNPVEYLIELISTLSKESRCISCLHLCERDFNLLIAGLPVGSYSTKMILGIPYTSTSKRQNSYCCTITKV